jgi:two-component system cell cycle sensor histidine kinase/response regulator CckA
MSTILVVDDEPPIRALVARVLERKGFRVITCENASEALAVTDAIDLMVVDLILPEVNGRDLTEKMRQQRPGLPVVLMSGLLADPDLMPPPPSMFMQKPMLPSAVVEAVEQMLRG